MLYYILLYCILFCFVTLYRIIFYMFQYIISYHIISNYNILYYMLLWYIIGQYMIYFKIFINLYIYVYSIHSVHAIHSMHMQNISMKKPVVPSPERVAFRQVSRARRSFGLQTACSCTASVVNVVLINDFRQYRRACDKRAWTT